MTNQDPEIQSAVQTAVIAEMRLLTAHLRSTIRSGLTIDKWLFDGLKWYEEQR